MDEEVLNPHAIKDALGIGQPPRPKDNIQYIVKIVLAELLLLPLLYLEGYN